MDRPIKHSQPTEPNEALRRLAIARASEINGKLLTRLSTVSDDLDQANHLGALGGLDGIETEISNLRSYLLLLR